MANPPWQHRPNRYLDRTAEELERGHPFFPNTIFKDIVAALLTLLVIVGLATLRGAPLEAEADPTGSARPPRPEWYFLFLFQALKYVPGEIEWLGAVVVPTIALAALFFLPLYDRSPWRHPLNRPLATGMAVIALGAIAVLTYQAVTSPEPAAVGAPQPASRLTPLERTGQNVYEEHSCPVCHTINGVGGTIGPDLSTVGRRLDASWLVAHLERPAEISPGTRMPAIALTNEELMALTAYLLTLTEPQTLTPAQRGQAVYEVYCNSCHPGGRAGLGPALIDVPAERVVQVVRSGAPGMPAFAPTALSNEQLAEITAYLQALR